VQVICIWSSLCHCHAIFCFLKIHQDFHAIIPDEARDVQLQAEWRHIRTNLLNAAHMKAASGKTALAYTCACFQVSWHVCQSMCTVLGKPCRNWLNWLSNSTLVLINKVALHQQALFVLWWMTIVLDAQTQNGDEPVGEITSFSGQSCLSSVNSCWNG